MKTLAPMPRRTRDVPAPSAAARWYAARYVS
jgi:hypothetical protein